MANGIPVLGSKEHRHVHHADLHGIPRMYSIHNLTKRVLVGNAFVVVDANDKFFGLIWDIWIREDMRRQGYGENLLQSIQKDFLRLETAWRTEAGKELCLKCGFRLQKAMFKNQVDKLIWEKGDEE